MLVLSVLFLVSVISLLLLLLFHILVPYKYFGLFYFIVKIVLIGCFGCLIPRFVSVNVPLELMVLEDI